MSAFYNEIDPYCAQWLRNLIAAGLIPDGVVDERSIEDIAPDELAGFTQCHFFAGIAGWPLALRQAGILDDYPLWTGSCPCQPYSVASVAHGGAKGQADRRHLWPEFYRLIRERKPSIVFGEQVPSAIKWGWWDEAAMDLEEASYACAASVLRAKDFGAKHERKRLYWVANSRGSRRERHIKVKSFPLSKEETFSVDGDPLTRAGRALDGDYGDLLPVNGVPVVVERARTKGYGNAICVPQAVAFIRAAMNMPLFAEVEGDA